MANFKSLKKGADKGAPPPATRITENLRKPPREKEEKGKIEFSVPRSVIEDFSQEAAERCGFKKGSKSDFFMLMWEEYLSRKTG